MFEDAQVRHLSIGQDVANDEDRHIRLVGQPLTLSRTPSRMGVAAGIRRADQPGLKGVGFGSDEIAGLRDAKVV